MDGLTRRLDESVRKQRCPATCVDKLEMKKLPQSAMFRNCRFKMEDKLT
jgi:hypothetical protein